MNVNEQYAEQLADFVRDGEVFALTGAGMSTDSGIPDYRRPDGTRRAVPMTFSEFIGSEAAQRRYWIRSTVGWQRFAAATPNDGHRQLAAWQREGRIERLVTQNVDGLHAAAGSRDVVELHGSLAAVRCLECDHRFPRAQFQHELERLNPELPHAVSLLADGDAEVDPRWEDAFVLARCPRCASTSLKPDVVMFGENVAPAVVAECFEAVENARAVLVLGSSLKVMSGYRFVLAALAQNKPVALVGLGQMRGVDKATLVLPGSLTPMLVRAGRILAPDPEAQIRRRTAVTFPMTEASVPSMGS